jgi:hypothetical protein
MSDNLKLRKIAGEYADGEISEAEFLRRVLDEIAHQHPTSFWSKVIELKDNHDYATKPYKR